MLDWNWVRDPEAGASYDVFFASDFGLRPSTERRTPSVAQFLPALTQLRMNDVSGSTGRLSCRRLFAIGLLSEYNFVTVVYDWLIPVSTSLSLSIP